MKPPQVMVLDRIEGINAFATGWGEDNAVIAVTRGALDRFTREELQGLVAHELSPLREGDTRLNMSPTGVVFGLEMIFNLGERMSESREDGRRSLLAVPGVVVMACGALGWIGGRILKAAVSRQREFLADARAVQFTRSKEGLGGVLRKVMGEQASRQAPHGLDSRQRMSPAVHHMLLVGTPVEASWLATHSPLAERVRCIYGRNMPAVASAWQERARAVI